MDARPTRPKNGYQIFIGEDNELLKGLTGQERIVKAGQLWKELSADEKSKYNCETEWEDYRRRLAEWKLTHPQSAIGKKNDDSSTRTKESGETTHKNHVAIFFAVGHLKKFAARRQVTLPHSTKLASLLKTRFNMLGDAGQEVWLRYWNQLDTAKRDQIIAYYNAWKITNER
ncbi:HMG (high mobility group) box-containing protein [Giardia muris]|uniref:HMG (High mobility group) box-containing protein n=1 Tax=Giardia muris TaxID=5742 RepID=A0A4Z1SYB0_GIAMU|nr:HMG (high mobility group) box-containing protein [Giardia muris]|eukprot:TNJ30480.1 HMG (high mobility group) box-containing protein [Giardia muris]